MAANSLSWAEYCCLIGFRARLMNAKGTPSCQIRRVHDRNIWFRWSGYYNSGALHEASFNTWNAYHRGSPTPMERPFHKVNQWGCQLHVSLYTAAIVVGNPKNDLNPFRSWGASHSTTAFIFCFKGAAPCSVIHCPSNSIFSSMITAFGRLGKQRM